jgi:4-hydroxy-2-oxoheptanedioate aldolase
MNKTEKQMVEILTDLKQSFHVTGIKAEFEAEGTRMEEALLLKDVVARAGVGLNIKVGGCEAIKDMFDAIALGAERIIGPMVETPYALKKFLGAAKIAFFNGGYEDCDLLINLETLTSFQNFDKMLEIPEIEHLDGIVIGRVDLTGSMGLTREAVNSKEVLELSLLAAAKAKARGLQVVIGGGVSVHSKPFFAKFPKGHLDRFETRKVIFGCPGALDNPEEAYLRAVEFEILWLKNKRDYYGAIHREDEKRISMMEERYKKSIEAIQGILA